jgi:hypothetical protein
MANRPLIEVEGVRVTNHLEVGRGLHFALITRFGWKTLEPR